MNARSKAARPSVAQPVADAAAMAPAPRPTHIIVFRSAGAKPVEATALAMKLQVREAPGRTGVKALIASEHATVKIKAYGQLGAATAFLSEEEAGRMASLDEVAGVFPNLRRSVPLPVGVRSAPTTAAGADALQLAYLQGLRDAAEMAIQRMGGHVHDAPSSAAAVHAAVRHSWCLDLIGIPRTYRKATGKGVRVAVLDTGIDRQHPDLAARIVAYRNFSTGSSDNDVVQHGTHCAGVIAGAAKAAGGVRYGVAPAVELVVGKVLNDSGSGYDNDILDAIDWAIDQGARVISMSLGSARGVGQDYARPYELIAGHLLGSQPGVLIVAAAGNESRRDLGRISPVGNPAACPSILSVAAADRQSSVAYFSCGSLDGIGAVDISAPGVDVLSARPGGGTQFMSGTSMATPHVAGVAALYAQLHPKDSAKQLWQRLTQRAKTLGSTNDYGAGLLQAPK